MIIAANPYARNPYPFLFGDDVSIDTRAAYSLAPRMATVPANVTVQTAPPPTPTPSYQTAPAPPPEQPVIELPTSTVVYEPEVAAQPIKKKCPWWCWLLIAGGVTTVGLIGYKIVKG